MIHQLNPPIPVITPKGKAIAHAMIDYGMESDLQWVCFQDGTGECWTWRNPQVRAQLNITQGRDHISTFYNPDDVAFKKEDDEEEGICDECGEGTENCCCEVEEDWKAAYDSKEDDYQEARELIREFKEDNHELITRKNQLTELLLKLYNDDQVHPNQRGEVREILVKTDEFMDGFNGRIVSKI